VHSLTTTLHSTVTLPPKSTIKVTVVVVKMSSVYRASAGYLKRVLQSSCSSGNQTNNAMDFGVTVSVMFLTRPVIRWLNGGKQSIGRDWTRTLTSLGCGYDINLWTTSDVNSVLFP
jgi:hypothetical protein